MEWPRLNIHAVDCYISRKHQKGRVRCLPGQQEQGRKPNSQPYSPVLGLRLRTESHCCLGRMTWSWSWVKNRGSWLAGYGCGALGPLLQVPGCIWLSQEGRNGRSIILLLQQFASIHSPHCGELVATQDHTGSGRCWSCRNCLYLL